MAAAGSYGTRAGSVNDWPGGPRGVTCLRCDRRFVSRGKAQRLCGSCRGRSVEEQGFRLMDAGHTLTYRQVA